MTETPEMVVPSAQIDSNNSTAPLLTVSQLSVRYLGTDRWLLGDVSFELLDGQVTAIIGPSGCGKSTLIRTVCGLVPHCLPSEYSGSVRLLGQEIADATVEQLAESVGYVGQNPDAAVVTRSVYDDVAFPLQNLRWPREKIERRVVEVLEQVGLLPHLWEDPWTLSGGQRQRLALAAALATRPRLLVLDEPTSTIDTAGREHIYDIVATLALGGCGVVVIDHDIDPLLPIIDEVLALDATGATIARGSAEEVFTQHRTELEASGVWLPRAIRKNAGRPTVPFADVPGQEPAAAMPKLDDFIGDRVRYYAKDDQGWQECSALDTTTQDGTAALLDVEGLCVAGRSPAVSLTLAGGELVALIGPNGAGKSSLIAALAGLLPFEATRAFLQGRALRRGRYEVGCVFQNPEHQLVTSTVENEIRITGADDELCAGLLHQFHLWDHRDRHPLTLSGGQARRLSVSTMVAEQRDVVVLDEPTYGQDWDNTRELIGFINGLQDEGRSVIIATHDLEFALQQCSHIIALPDQHTSRTGTSQDEPAADAGRGEDGARGNSVSEPPAQPERRRGLMSALNPMTIFLATIPLMIGTITLHRPGFSVTVMALSTLLMIAARAPWRRTAATVASLWGVVALMFLVFRYGWANRSEASSLYDLGGPLVASTGIGGLLSLVLLSGIYSRPSDVVTALTTTFKLPYRIGAAATSAISFISCFQRDFTILRAARALRGIGTRWGLLAPVVRWVGSLVPLMILAVQHAERVALSMDSRAFGAYPSRTELVPVRWRLLDWVVVAPGWCLGLGILFFA